MHIQAFELHTNHHEATFSFPYDLHRFHKMSEETLKFHCVNLLLKLSSDLHKTDLDGVKPFEKIVS